MIAQNRGIYLVEISTISGQDLFIAAYDTQSDESLLIEVNDPAKRDQIIDQFQNDFEVMADSLQVISKRLVLLNPRLVLQKREEAGKETELSQHNQSDTVNHP